MKNFSTAALVLALSSVFTVLVSPSAQARGNASCEFLADAPDQHVVVKGDTLWGISSKFLHNAWCWPQVWGVNKDQIRNPHWIYPGQVVYFDRTSGRLRLGNMTGNGSGGVGQDGKLSPQIRVETLGPNAIPTIPASLIEPFMSQPLIVEEGQLKDAPRIVATQEGRVNLGKGDKAYVRGDLKDDQIFQVFRPGTPLKDPVTKALLGYEAVFLGTVKLQGPKKEGDDVYTFTLVTVKEEMSVGDRLLPLPPNPIINYMPHPPAGTVDARIVSIYGGVANAGQNQVVSINRGQSDGIDVATVLDLYRPGGVIVDKTVPATGFFGNKVEQLKLPDEQYGSLFIFRVFDKISYGLIMQVRDTVNVGDVAKSPE